MLVYLSLLLWIVRVCYTLELRLMRGRTVKMEGVFGERRGCR